jgi:hypothetical protein
MVAAAAGRFCLFGRVLYNVKDLVYGKLGLRAVDGGSLRFGSLPHEVAPSSNVVNGASHTSHATAVELGEYLPT